MLERFYYWIISETPNARRFNMAVVCFISTSMAFVLVPKPNTDPLPKKERVSVVEVPEAPRQAAKTKPKVDHRERDKARCVWQRKQAEANYAEITKNAHLGDVDNDAAVDAWRRWAAVEKRCSEL